MLSRFRTIRGAMIFSYMAITLLALLIFLLFSLNYTERTILENSESYTIQLVEQVNGGYRFLHQFIWKTSWRLLRTIRNSPIIFFDRMEHIMMRGTDPGAVLSRCWMPGLISATFAVFLQRNGAGRSSTEERTQRNPYVDLASMPWYQDTMEAEGKAVISASHVQNAIEGKYQWVITLSKGLINPETHEVEGIFFVDLNYSSIQELCTNVNLGSKSYLFIVGKKERSFIIPSSSCFTAA